MSTEQFREKLLLNVIIMNYSINTAYSTIQTGCTNNNYLVMGVEDELELFEDLWASNGELLSNVLELYDISEEAASKNQGELYCDIDKICSEAETPEIAFNQVKERILAFKS